MEKIAGKVEAAVAVIEVPEPRQEVLILRRTVRKDDPWSGQYSFPGGRCVAGDASPLATAVRETEEETGIVLSGDMPVRELPPTFVGRGGITPILVQPFHFIVPEFPSLSLNPEEMQAAYRLDVQTFLQPEGHALRETLPERLPGRLFPSWPIEDYFLWGFTYELVLKIFSR